MQNNSILTIHKAIFTSTKTFLVKYKYIDKLHPVLTQTAVSVRFCYSDILLVKLVKSEMVIT